MRTRHLKKEFRISKSEFLNLEKNYQLFYNSKTDFIMMSVYNSLNIERNISNDFIYLFDQNINFIKNKCKKFNDKEYIENIYQCLVQLNDFVQNFINHIHIEKLFLGKNIIKDQFRLSFNITEQENQYFIKAVKYFNYINQTDFIRALIINNIYNQEIYFKIQNSLSLATASIINIMKRLNYFSYLTQDEKNYFMNYSYQIRNQLILRS